MVNEPKINVKDMFFLDDLETVYDKACEDFLQHKGRFYFACCRKSSDCNDYILYGSYKQKELIDAKVTAYKDGIPEFETVKLTDFRKRRILHKKCNHTHGLLLELFIPFQKWTLRYVLLQLGRFFRLGLSIEKYCLEYDVPIKAFRKWLDWLKKNISFLYRTGLVTDARENRETLKTFVSEITDHVGDYVLKSLRLLDLALFQSRRIPAD